ncbi:hypothetical protein ACHAWO_002685 [Cyclotella atomus]|uniref:Uncharacterized protein n=1 Tax=Cyclotella atomus TaxID=382360 RepID=A0ABD3NA20_9STRA
MANTNCNSTLTISIHILNHDYSDLGTALNRAILYTQLGQICRLANEQLQKSLNICCHGDGLVFGAHCATFHNTATKATSHDNDAWINHLQEEMEGPTPKEVEYIPHLIARYRYGNDVNDAWRIISSVLDLSTQISSLYNVAIECLDEDDGQSLFIEAAEVLPYWVDEDVSQGGVGGPNGCVNRCWIVDGLIRLIPPVSVGGGTARGSNCKVDLLSRREALYRLKGCIGSELFVVEEVQSAIEDRIARTDYTIPKRSRCGDFNKIDDANKKECGSSHFHVAAVGVPATVAHFLQRHGHLVPFLVDSFCNVAPDYLDGLTKEKQALVAKCKESDVQSDTVGCAETGGDTITQSRVRQQQSEPTNVRKSTSNSNLGNNFSYECIVLLPITMTRTTYAELITGRGKIPSFPIPKEYRSVELNRFQRQLLQMRGERNVWKRAVDVGIRLSTGLDWILNSTVKSSRDLADDDSFMQSMGEVERRLRIHWCRIDAEARSNASIDGKPTNDATSWIEETWQAGPNGSTDKILSDAIQCMSKCPVFHPELSKSPFEEPCPYSRPGVSLQVMVKSGIERALRFVSEEYDAAFPFPREWEVDDDSWMEVNSLEELEDEMNRLASHKNETSKRPRRTTRRSRRNMVHSEMQDPADNKVNEIKSLSKMIDGFKSLVEGEGDHVGVVTHTASAAGCMSPQQAMSKEVDINPRLFLDSLQSKLHSRAGGNLEPMSTNDQDVSMFFFKEDLEDGDESSTENSQDMGCDQDITEVQPVSGSLTQIMQALDSELRSGEVVDQSVDFDVISNLLNSLEAESDTSGPGPVSNILREMGLCPPRVDSNGNE